MNFKPELIDKILAGEKTETRRPVNYDNPRSHWYVGKCFYRPGRDYAICPGRVEPGVARIEIEDVRQGFIGDMTDADGRREGFADQLDFLAYFKALHPKITPMQIAWLRVWVVRFSLAEAGS